MSFSSSLASGILSYISSDSTTTWQVEQAQEPPQAPIHRDGQPRYSMDAAISPALAAGSSADISDSPSISMSLACAMSSKLSPLETSNVYLSPSLSMNVTWSL